MLLIIFERFLFCKMDYIISVEALDYYGPVLVCHDPRSFAETSAGVIPSITCLRNP
jgi:hypothetical protein